MKRAVAVCLAASLLLSGATFALAQNGPRWGYPPALYYGYYNYYYAEPYYGAPFYSLAPHYFPGHYPGAPAYRFWGWCSSVLATPSARVAAMTSTSRNLKPFATTYWAPYACEITFYLQDDHPSGARHLIARCGKGYSGPYLPIVDGMPEFAKPIPSDMTEQDIIYRFVAPWAAPRSFPPQVGNA